MPHTSCSGKYVELQYELQSYGIPPAALPLDTSGRVNNNFQKLWFERRCQIERHSQTTAASLPQQEIKLGELEKATISGPSSTTASLSLLQAEPNDVILGRGKGFDQHKGNVKFRQYLQRPEVLKKFQCAPKYVKIEYVERIKATLQLELGVRFLKKEPGTISFQLADDVAITHKISRTFRRLVQHNQKKESQGNTGGS